MTRIIQPQYEKPSTVSIDEGNQIIEEMLADRELNPSATQPEVPKTSELDFPRIEPTQGVKIESLEAAFRIHNVKYRNELWVVDFSKELLDNGAEKNQEDWMIWQANQKVWQIPNSQLYHAIISTLYANRNTDDQQSKELLEELKGILKKEFGNQRMMTSTRVMYDPSGNDVIFHDWNTPKPLIVNQKMVGEDGWINSSCGFENEIEALFGTRDLIQVENVYAWLSGKKPYLYRVNSTPDSVDERAVVLGVDGYDFNIDAYVGNDWPALGVVTRRARKSK